MSERCERCGANLALVGRVHNCRPRAVPLDDGPQPLERFAGGDVTGDGVGEAGSSVEAASEPREGGAAGSNPARSTKKRAPRGTFDRRAYQRDLMRRRRKKKAKTNG